MSSYQFSKEDTLCVKALAVMLMMIHHLFGFPEKLQEGVSFMSLSTLSSGHTVMSLAGNFGKLCIALFMILSGYGMYCSYRNNPDNMTGIILKRIKTLYVKYWQIFIIFIPIGIILGSDKISLQPVDLIKNFLAIETTYNDEWWFVTMYIFILLTLPLVIRFLNRAHANPFTDLLWMLGFNAFVNTSLITFINSNETIQSFNGTYFCSKALVLVVMLPMFVAGCYLAKYNVIAQIRNHISSQVFAKLLGFALLVITFILRQNWAMRTNWGWDRLDFIYACTFTVGVALILDGLTLVKKGLAFIGTQATGIWLIHTFFCYYYWQSFTYITKNPISIFLILLVICFGISYSIDKLIRFIYYKKVV